MKSFSTGLFLLAFVLLSTVQIGSGRRFGGGPGRGHSGIGPPRGGHPGGHPGGRPGKPFGHGSDQDSVWTESGIVPDLLAEEPSNIISLQWPSLTVSPNDTVVVGRIMERPRLTWPSQPDALYTVLIVDAGMEDQQGGKDWFHWMVTNIPGDDLMAGTEVIEYVPPFSIELTAEGTIDKTKAHPMLALVYRQTDTIEVTKPQRGCVPDLIVSRFLTKTNLAKGFGLSLESGSFFWVPYSGRGTNQMLCRVSRCTRQPFPILLQGINDAKNCQPSEEVLEVAVRGPKLALLAEYNRAISVFNPTSISSLIRATKYKGISTGVSREFRALYGSFGSTPDPAGNLDSTLEGDISVDFLMYESEEAASRLLQLPENLVAEFPEIVQALGELAPTLAGDGFYHIIVGQPEDQDFDADSLMLEPDSIIWMQLANVRPWQQEQFLELRDTLIMHMINSPYITSSYKFDVEREALDGLADTPYYKDNSRTELMLYTAQSTMNQQAFLNGLFKTDPEFLTAFLGTFECIACTAISGDYLSAEYYPPFSV